MDFSDAERIIQDYGYLALGLALIAEMIPGLGLLVPGVSTLLLAGAFAANGDLSLTLVFIIALAATTIGDTISYRIGRSIQAESPKAKAWSQQLQPWVKRAEANSPLLLVFKFVGPARALFPATLGWLGMGWKKWIAFDLLAGSLFVGIMTSIGFLVGHNVDDVASAGGAVAVGLLILNVPFFIYLISQARSRKSKE